MPVALGIWRIDGDVRRLDPSPLPLEQLLEDAIARDASILGLDLLIVGRQVATKFGKKVDLLGVDNEGHLHVIELKRDRTPRDVVAQALEYGAWVKDLSYDDISKIFTEYSPERRLEQAFTERFGGQPPEALNESHRLVIVASELDAATERIVTYLASEYGVPLNAVFFRHFDDDGRRYLARSWLIEPNVAEAVTAKPQAARAREPWNGQDWYVAVGGDEHRAWEDMRRFSFVSAGGGRWYWKTLEHLPIGARIFAHIPGAGYVGVGMVEEPARIVTEATIAQDGRQVPLLELPLRAPKMAERAHDLELAERVVKVRWLKTLPREQAVWERGFYANQNSATPLRSRFTLERVTQRFGLEG